MGQFGKIVYGRLIAIGAGIMIGAVLSQYVGSMTHQQAMECWAAGATFVVAGGVFYLCTRHLWDRGSLL